MTELPSTAIGLIAFIIAGAGALLWRMASKNSDANNETVKTFMTYIEKKNGNLERATQLFTANIEEQAMRHKDAMIDQNERHKQMMDDIAARLENISFAKPTRRKKIV